MSQASKNNIRKREHSQNLIHQLQDRESGIKRHHLHCQPPPLLYERRFYKCITPKLTIQDVNTPRGYMRKFTPDGSMLLSFSIDQRSLVVFSFRGVGKAAALVQNEKRECIATDDRSDESRYIRQNLFERLFKEKLNIRLATDSNARCHLHREFSIFMDDGRYVLLAAMGFSEHMSSFTDFYAYPDILNDLDIFSYTFFLVDLKNGVVSDIVTYHNDNITLSHNHGVSVYGNTISLLSRYRQSIEILELVNGKLVRLYEIGPSGCKSVLNEALPIDDEVYYSELPLSHLKQRILAYLYQDIMSLESEQLKRVKLKQFYSEFKNYELMIIDKVQLIDSDHLLLRYEERPKDWSFETSWNADRTEFKLYVFYSISAEEVLQVYTRNSVELLYLLRNFCDQFRNVRSLQTHRTTSSPSNNVHFRQSFNSAITSIPGGEKEAALRFNPTVPVSTQSFSTTQYLDYSLFNYDDRLISALERPKISSLEPIRFSDRNTNITKFRLFLEPRSDATAETSSSNGGAPAGPRELVAFIFHPYEPFIISIQKLAARYVVNFHIYNENTVVP